MAHWARRAGHIRPDSTERRVGILAGYGNTSYGDYFIGLGMATAAFEAKLQPVILGRDSKLEAFRSAGIEAHGLPDRDHGLRDFSAVASQLSGFILGGGGLFEDRVDATASQTLAAGYAARAVYAKNHGIPTIIYGVGVEREPFALQQTEKILSQAFRGASSVAVRDRDSVEACRRFGVEAQLVIDPATIFLNSVRPEPSIESGTAGLIPFARRAWPRMSNPSEVEHARQDADWEIAAQRLAGYRRVIITPFHRSDLEYVDRIHNVLTSRVHKLEVEIADFTPENPGGVLGVLRKCEHILTMRYHGFMAAHFAGVPSIDVLGGSQKLRVTDALNREGLLGDMWDASRASKQIQSRLRQFDIYRSS
ncbi:polysaccharide pyruvyl transferase family protein [Rhodococcus pyridinivorans]|uniref:polysaccharide pyruvyl transferase family protein n=1 Tax=Rhodococcus pyridinivorans TaxID=103816 RepID=UPI003AAEF13A